MSIQPSIRFNSSADVVIGFEDLGCFKSSTDDASNQLMVFMLRGNRNAWKQPIAFFLGSHSVPPDILKKMLMKVLADVHEAGIEVS